VPLPLERRTVTSRLCSGAATSLCTFAPWQASIEDYSAAEIGRLEAAAEVRSRAQHRRRLAPPQLSHAFAPQRAETRRRLAPPSPLPPSPRGACRGEEAAALLSKAERPVAIVGTQWFFSPYRDSLHAFLDAYQTPCFLNGGARGALRPDDHRFFRLCRSKALAQADVVAIFGTPWDFRLGYGSKVPDDCFVIQVDQDPQTIGHNRGAQVGLHADAGLVMQQLASAGARKAGDWLAQVRAMESERYERMVPEMNSSDTPINPLRFSKELADAIPEDATIVCDGGDIVGTAAKLVNVHNPGHWMDPGPLGTLGVGPGFAMAAKLARPNSPVFIIYGDGSFGLNGFEFEAMVRQNIPVIGVMGNDAAWTQIRRGQEEMFGADRLPATGLAFTRYDTIVQAMGGHGEYVEDPTQIRPAIERGLASGKPALINVKIGTSNFRKGSISV